MPATSGMTPISALMTKREPARASCHQPVHALATISSILLTELLVGGDGSETPLTDTLRLIVWATDRSDRGLSALGRAGPRLGDYRAEVDVVFSLKLDLAWPVSPGVESPMHLVLVSASTASSGSPSATCCRIGPASPAFPSRRARSSC